MEEEEKTQLYLDIVKELTKFGKLEESLNYVSRAIAAVQGKKFKASESKDLSNYL